MDTHTQNDPNNPINYEPPAAKCCDICGIEEYQTYFIDDTQICEDCMMLEDEDLIISEYAKIIAKNIKVNKEGQADVFDVIELAIQIGVDNGLYDENDEENLYWNDIDRNKCYSKAHEII